LHRSILVTCIQHCLVRLNSYIDIKKSLCRHNDRPKNHQSHKYPVFEIPREQCTSFFLYLEDFQKMVWILVLWNDSLSMVRFSAANNSSFLQALHSNLFLNSFKSIPFLEWNMSHHKKVRKTKECFLRREPYWTYLVILKFNQDFVRLPHRIRFQDSIYLPHQYHTNTILR
jgi:hypothetical protein